MIRYAFLGPMASGKTTSALKLIEAFPDVEKLSFAAPVKEIATIHFGMTTKDRSLLQIIGMTGRILDPETWVNKLISKIEPNKSYVVDDVRFPNEWIALRKLGFITVWLDVSKEERVRRLKATYGEEQAKHHIENMETISEHSVNSAMADVIWRNVDEQIEEIKTYLKND